MVVDLLHTEYITLSMSIILAVAPVCTGSIGVAVPVEANGCTDVVLIAVYDYYYDITFY